MGMFSRISPPALPRPTSEGYSTDYFDLLLNTLRLYFNGISGVQQINVAQLNINLDTLPTQADVATLRTGDVYRDTTASHVLKVKV